MATIGVLLSGCGVLDGSEIHEATLALYFLDKAGAKVICLAPEMTAPAMDHAAKAPSGEMRNVRVEAARIARGAMTDVASMTADSLDGLILPGGFGAAKNLCDFAEKGAKGTVFPAVATLLAAMHAAGKPIGALCIAPVILAKVLGNVTLTIGQDQGTADNLAAMGARHQPTMQGEIAIDREQKIVSTPCYMLNSRIDQIAEGADNLIKAMLAMMA